MIDELALVHVLLGAVALISCLSVENRRAIRTMPRGLWVVVILLVPVAGPVAWFAAGRPHALTRRRRWRIRGRADPPRPPAPDDDADFLRSLGGSAGHDGDSAPSGSAPPGSAPPGSAPPGSAPPGSAPSGSAPPGSERPDPEAERPDPEAERPDPEAERPDPDR